ncbi:MAG: GSCFA domain-containing protein [Bacteroidales bacterium]|nr:GSCFA domain-containing protein [Bacteroidales bacterium]MBN2757859.1 GSCFA domain-containing protein [Bacteroidales bacterium]
MQFRTEVFTDKFDTSINYKGKYLFIGSCFTENIGNKLNQLKFNALINPFGVLYNPVSVKKSIDLLIEKKLFNESMLEFYNEKWFSFYHHSKFSSSDKNEALKLINNGIDKAHLFLKESKILFITFGTSWVYKLKKENKFVSNCHKLPSKLFEHLFLDKETIVKEYKVLINSLLRFNPALKIIFTVSPIRHWKDGAINNQLSKSNLIVAIHELVKSYENVNYFPAYEIMMDDLRDYRYYSDDLLHLNNQAINYIWQKFIDSFIEKETLLISKEVEKFISAKNHVPFYPKSEAYKKFVADNLRKINEFMSINTNIDLKSEKEYFENVLNH